MLTMGRPPAPTIRLPRNKATTRNIRQPGNLTIAQTRINPLSQPRLPPRQQRRLNSNRRIHARHDIRDRNADFDRRPVPLPRDVHEAHFGFDHDVVACAVAVGACLAIAGHGGVDEAGVESGDGLVVEFVFCEGAWEVVFYEDVAFADEGVEDGDPGWVVEGEG